MWKAVLCVGTLFLLLLPFSRWGRRGKVRAYVEKEASPREVCMPGIPNWDGEGGLLAH